MEAKSSSFLFLSRDRFQIPYFQRPYVWSEDNWRKLINNIIDNNYDYFIGSVIIQRVKDDLFSIKYGGNNSVEIDIHRTFIDTECEDVLKEFIHTNKNWWYDYEQFMTALIFLNIAACHIYPYSKFLFYLGKYLLNKWNLPKICIVED